MVRSTNEVINANFVSIAGFQNIHKCTLSYIRASATKWPWVEDILTQGLEIIVGNGASILFWQDSWIGHQPLKLIYPRLFMISTQKDDFIINVGSWIENEWVWDLQWRRRRIFNWELEQCQSLM